MDEIEKLFQQSDFSSESIGLETRIWNRITNFKEANMPIDKTKITKEMMEKAEQCKTADDLVALAKANGITLTKVEDDRLAGFPHHALDVYLPKLIRAGYRVAICDELNQSKKLQ